MKVTNRRTFLLTSAGSLAAYAGLSKTNHALATAQPPLPNPPENTKNPSWSLVILPDTQHYAQKYPGLFHLQTQWILENKDKYNIVYVLQNGDVTNNNTEIQWQRASQAFTRLDGEVPYAISLGNHDFGPNGSMKERSTLANDYFPPTRFESWPTWGAPMESGKIDNNFHLFSVAGQQYLILCLEFGPRNEALDWANHVVQTHPNHKTIVMTHAYLYSDSTRYDWSKKHDEQKWNPHNYPVADSSVNDGREMWDKLVKKHPNIFMTVNGHVLNDGLGFLTSQADHGNNVHQMLVNFQMLPNGGDAWLRILTFHPNTNTVEVKDYSPLYENFNTDPDNQFTFRL